MIYDLFYVSNKFIDDTDWNNFRLRFPSAQKIDNVKSFDDIKKKAFTKFFWVVWDDLIVSDDFIFDYRIPLWDEKYTHVWLNGSHYNGICLFPKAAEISNREFDLRFFINSKEMSIKASQSKDTEFDIVFISYNEPNAEINFFNIQKKFPRVKRIHGITGIHQAHIEAAKIVETEMFWVVDGDAEILDGFEFNFNDPEKFTVHIWCSKNPINDLEYGYGGVKLLPTARVLSMDMNRVDMTTSISEKVRVVGEVSNITAFNTDPFSTWRSAFRECAKLSSKSIDRNYEQETEDRLITWCSLGKDREFGEYAIAGAKAGSKYGIDCIMNINELSKINDFQWLQEQFNNWIKDNESVH